MSGDLLKNAPVADEKTMIAAVTDMWEGQHVVFDHVKNGRSYGTGLRIADVLAIKKTWSPITIKCAEVKISRSDFLGDHKWPEYMEQSNMFYWACPKGLIRKSEVDKQAGLIWYNPASGKCTVVKAAIYRKVAPNPETLLYLLLWRLDDSHPHNRMDIVNDMAERVELGKTYRTFVARKLNTANERLREMQKMVDDMNCDNVTEILAFMKANKIRWGSLSQALSLASKLLNMPDVDWHKQFIEKVATHATGLLAALAVYEKEVPGE